MSEKKLIINADDLGLSRGITDGILVAHQEGVLTSASLMVNQPATEYAVKRLESTSTLDVGIHLNLCQGFPIVPPEQVPSLVDSDGRFLPPAKMGRRLVQLRVSSKEIEREFCAQIDRMLSYGLVPSHADSHHRFHIYPGAAHAFRRALTSRGIERARAPRKEYWPANGHAGGPHAGGLCRRVAVRSYNEYLQRVVFRRLKLPDAGVAFHPKYRGKLGLLPQAWLSTLENMPAGIYEMWCHPGWTEAGFSDSDVLREQRELEIQILTDKATRRTVERAGIRLVNFQSL